MREQVSPKGELSGFQLQSRNDENVKKLYVNNRLITLVAQLAQKLEESGNSNNAIFRDNRKQAFTHSS